MPSVAIVTGFSEQGYQLLRQCLASCDIAISMCKTKADFTAYCYRCNQQKGGIYVPFSEELPRSEDLPLKHVKIVIKESHTLPDLGYQWLPDIRVYHDFTTKYLDQFDYALFIHDDIYFRPIPLFDEIISIISEPGINIIAEHVMTCRRDISIRFHPCFIFVKTTKFRQSNLSFINDYHLLNPDSFRTYNPQIDGGAGLLASYYHTANQVDADPLSKMPKIWFAHLRMNNSHGIETYNNMNPNSIEFDGIIKQAEEYADSYFFREDDE